MKNMIISNENNKIFDNYQDVSVCNHCEHYYTSACDGKCKKANCSNEKPSQNASDDFCKAFIPTRRYFIMEDLRRIKRHLRLLDWILGILTILVILQCIGVL